MPHTTEWDQDVITRTYTGLLDPQELIDANLAMYGDERFSSLKYIIADFSAAEGIAFDQDNFSENMKTHAHLNLAAAKSNPGVKLAVIGTGALVQAFNQSYEDEAQEIHVSWETRLFPDTTSAKAWLGID